MPTARASTLERSDRRGETRVTGVPARLGPITRADHRIIDEKLLDNVAIGANRADVIAHLGEPSTRFSIAGLPGGDRETLIYHVAKEERVQVALAADVVTNIFLP